VTTSWAPPHLEAAAAGGYVPDRDTVSRPDRI